MWCAAWSLAQLSTTPSVDYAVRPAFVRQSVPTTEFVTVDRAARLVDGSANERTEAIIQQRCTIAQIRRQRVANTTL